MAKSNDKLPETIVKPVAPVSKSLTPDEREKIASIGRAFYGQGWKGSDANARAEEIGKLLSPRLAGTGRALLLNVRAPFADATGALKSGGNYDESVRRFSEIGSAGMGEHFVAAVEATLSGRVIPAALASRVAGARRGTL